MSTPAAPTPPVTRHCPVCQTHRPVSHRQGRSYWVLRYCHHVVTVLISENGRNEWRPSVAVGLSIALSDGPDDRRYRPTPCLVSLRPRLRHPRL